MRKDYLQVTKDLNETTVHKIILYKWMLSLREIKDQKDTKPHLFKKNTPISQ